MSVPQGSCPVDPSQMEALLLDMATGLLALVKPEEELVLLGIRLSLIHI